MRSSLALGGIAFGWMRRGLLGCFLSSWCCRCLLQILGIQHLRLRSRFLRHLRFGLSFRLVAR